MAYLQNTTVNGDLVVTGAIQTSAGTYLTYNSYGECSTTATTTTKTVTITGYKLNTGCMVTVKFTNAVPASATLNVNSTGAKAIYFNGAAITATVIDAGDVITFVYDGTYYQIVGTTPTYVNNLIVTALNSAV